MWADSYRWYRFKMTESVCLPFATCSRCGHMRYQNFTPLECWFSDSFYLYIDVDHFQPINDPTSESQFGVLCVQGFKSDIARSEMVMAAVLPLPHLSRCPYPQPLPPFTPLTPAMADPSLRYAHAVKVHLVLVSNLIVHTSTCHMH